MSAVKTRGIPPPLEKAMMSLQLLPIISDVICSLSALSYGANISSTLGASREN